MLEGNYTCLTDPYQNKLDMKKLFILLFLTAFISVNVSAQTANNCDLLSNYDKVFKVQIREFGDRKFTITSVNTLDEKHCLAKLVNENTQYLNYLLTHFSSPDQQQLSSLEKDTVQLQKTYIEQLRQDSVFNQVMQAFSSRVRAQEAFQPDTVSIDQLLNIAVKFFNIKGINEEGHYEGKVCAGINGITETETNRKPQLEAFCFASILENYQGNEFNMHDAFVSAIHELYKLNIGIDENDRLLRAQGGMYFLMRNNEQLRKMLLAEYAKKKEYLPFVLI